MKRPAAKKKLSPKSAAKDSREVPRFQKELALSEKETLRSRLELAQLQQRLDITALELELHNEICAITREGFQLEPVLDRIMDRVVKATATGAGTLFLLDDAGDHLIFQTVKGPRANRLAGQQMQADEGIAGWVVQTGSPYLASNVHQDPHWSGRVDQKLKFETHNLLAAPLQAAGKILGVIEVLNKKGGQPFNQSDLDLLTALSFQTALIIQNGRLFLAAEAKVNQLATLTELSAILNSSLDPKQVRTRAMQAAVKLLVCETGSLYLIDHEKNELYFEVALGDKGDVFKEIRLKIGEGIAGWVAEQGRSLLIPDCSKDPRWSSRADKKSKFQTRNMVTVPVKAKDKVIGVLQAINRLEGKLFDEEDLRLLESLADQVAIALENARLYEEQRLTFLQTAEALAMAIEKRDIYTGGHTRRVRDYCMAMVNYLNLSPEEKKWLELAAILHDVGKIGVDDQVLRKPGKLTDEEFAQIRAHPTIGYEIMSHIKTLHEVIPGMRHHHERPDGRGYPDGLHDDKIPFLARIIAVADTYDAMTSDRPYRKGLSDQAALEELRKFSGAQFDADAVAAFIKAHAAGKIIGQHYRPEAN